MVQFVVVVVVIICFHSVQDIVWAIVFLCFFLWCFLFARVTS